MANIITKKININPMAAIITTVVVLVLGAIAVLHDFGLIGFTVASGQMITILLLTFVAFEVGIKAFMKPNALTAIVGVIWLAVFVPFLIGFWIQNDTLSTVSGVGKLFLTVTAVILAYF